VNGTSDGDVSQRTSATATPECSPLYTPQEPLETRRLSENTPPGPAESSRHIPLGSYTDDPAANARHSADIADMMAARSRGSAARSAASAATALNALRLTEVAADKALLAVDRSPHTIRGERDTVDTIAFAAMIIALVALFENLCVVTIYGVVRPVFDAIDTFEYVRHPAQWTAPWVGLDATPGPPRGAQP